MLKAERGASVNSFLERNQIAVFFALTFLISWGGVLAVVWPTGLPGTAEDLDRLFGIVFIPMLISPALSALVISYVQGGTIGVKNMFSGLFRWRAKLLDYAAVFLLIPLCALAVLLSFSAISADYTPYFLSAESSVQTIFIFLGLGLITGLFEETGWTGFVLTRLWKGGSVLRLGIGFGVIHGVWHFLVTYWFEGDKFGLLIIPFLISLWLVALITMRILIVWVYSRTKSTLLAAVAHASHTGCLFVLWPLETTPIQDVLWTGAFALLGFVTVLALIYFTQKVDLENNIPGNKSINGLAPEQLEPFHPFRSATAKQEYLRFYDQKAKDWPSSSEQHFVDTSFGKTFVRVQGPPDASPLVLLPGDTETSLSWLPIIKPLSQSFRTYAIDHVYDNGRSIYSKNMTRPQDHVDWLNEVSDQLGLDHFNLVGYSYGAWQCALYALAHPERLEKLVLIAPSSTVLSPGLVILARAIIYFIFPFRAVTKNYFYWYGPDAVRSDQTRILVDEMIKEDLLARQCFKKRRFVSPTRLSNENWKALKVPTLYLVGENDRTYSAHQAVQRLRQVAPMVEPKIAPDTDHYIVLMNPEWVTKYVLRFLQRKGLNDRRLSNSAE